MTDAGSEFQTDGAAHRKERFAKPVRANGWMSSGIAVERSVRALTRWLMRWLRYRGTDVFRFLVCHMKRSVCMYVCMFMCVFPCTHFVALLKRFCIVFVCLSADLMFVIYVVDNVVSNPFRVWTTAGCPQTPTAKLFQQMRFFEVHTHSFYCFKCKI